MVLANKIIAIALILQEFKISLEVSWDFWSLVPRLAKAGLAGREGSLCDLSFVTLTVDCSVLAPFPDRIPRGDNAFFGVLGLLNSLDEAKRPLGLLFGGLNRLTECKQASHGGLPWTVPFTNGFGTI